MNKIKAYLTNPATWLAFCFFIFSLGWTYASLNNRISDLEKFQDEANIMELKTILVQVQRDIEWIKNDMQKIK